MKVLESENWAELKREMKARAERLKDSKRIFLLSPDALYIGHQLLLNPISYSMGLAVGWNCNFLLWQVWGLSLCFSSQVLARLIIV